MSQLDKRGYDILRNPLLNKGPAFTEAEREQLGLCGLIPAGVETLDQQRRRALAQVRAAPDPLGKYLELANIQDRNEHLYYSLLTHHIEEFLPIVYTPTVGLATQKFSDVFRRARGVWINPAHKGQIGHLFSNATSGRTIKLIVITDNESILGIGDQGAGGMAISIGKLALYTACAGIHPSQVLPISLDVGTDNEELRKNPFYLGWPKKRLRGEPYDQLVDELVTAVNVVFPGALLQWEDFRKDNALKILDRHRNKVLSFNDDIQGTGAVALAGILGGLRANGEELIKQRILIYGAGAAGLGIARQIRAALRFEGLSELDVAAHIGVLDSQGLLVADRSFEQEYKSELAWPEDIAKRFNLIDPQSRDLLSVLKAYKPTVLIGASGRAGDFTEEAIRTLTKGCATPIVLPLSNPTENSEATPADILRWTDGKARVATGSPFPPVGDREIGQGNNVFVFPGLGLGALVAQANRVSDAMISVSAKALAEQLTPSEVVRGLLYPEIPRLRQVTQAVAIAVAQQAISEGNAQLTGHVETAVKEAMWDPVYPDYTI